MSSRDVVKLQKGASSSKNRGAVREYSVIAIVVLSDKCVLYSGIISITAA